jgi:hypothetical protein
MMVDDAISSVADPESFHWVGIQYRNSAPQYAIVLTTVLRYLGRRKSRVVLSLPRTQLGPPLHFVLGVGEECICMGSG